MMLSTVLMLLGAQAAQPVGTVEVATVDVAQPFLSLPDVLAPALIPYVNCLMPIGRDAVATPDRDCSAQRAQAAVEANKAIEDKLSDHDRRELVETFLFNLDAIVANQKKVDNAQD